MSHLWKKFEGNKKFNNHIQSHQIFECEICHQTIKMNSRSNHSRKCGQKEIKAFACSEVDRQARLNLQKEKKHGTSTFEKFECMFCKSEFGSRNDLNVHVKSHYPWHWRPAPLNLALTLLLPCLIFSLTLPWTCPDLVLNWLWPCLDLALTLPWPCLHLAIKV